MGSWRQHQPPRKHSRLDADITARFSFMKPWYLTRTVGPSMGSCYLSCLHATGHRTKSPNDLDDQELGHDAGTGLDIIKGFDADKAFATGNLCSDWH